MVLLMKDTIFLNVVICFNMFLNHLQKGIDLSCLSPSCYIITQYVLSIYIHKHVPINQQQQLYTCTKLHKVQIRVLTVTFHNEKKEILYRYNNQYLHFSVPWRSKLRCSVCRSCSSPRASTAQRYGCAQPQPSLAATSADVDELRRITAGTVNGAGFVRFLKIFRRPQNMYY